MKKQPSKWILAVGARPNLPPGELSKNCLVVEKARDFLGWAPETDLKEGIRKTLEWRLNQP